MYVFGKDTYPSCEAWGKRKSVTVIVIRPSCTRYAGSCISQGPRSPWRISPKPCGNAQQRALFNTVNGRNPAFTTWDSYNPVNGINYQPQLVSRNSSIKSMFVSLRFPISFGEKPQATPWDIQRQEAIVAMLSGAFRIEVTFPVGPVGESVSAEHPKSDCQNRGFPRKPRIPQSKLSGHFRWLMGWSKLTFPVRWSFWKAGPIQQHATFIQNLDFNLSLCSFPWVFPRMRVPGSHPCPTPDSNLQHCFCLDVFLWTLRSAGIPCKKKKMAGSLQSIFRSILHEPNLKEQVRTQYKSIQIPPTLPRVIAAHAIPTNPVRIANGAVPLGSEDVSKRQNPWDKVGPGRWTCKAYPEDMETRWWKESPLCARLFCLSVYWHH